LGQPFLSNCQVARFGASTGLGYDGGAGKPGDVKGQYSWHAQLIEEAPDHTWATVRIWNAKFEVFLPLVRK
jgi:hypothetical protein